MTEAKHTELPWHVVEPARPRPQEENDRLIATKDKKHVAETFQYQNHDNQNGPGVANADFIVRACNSHYALLEACKAGKFAVSRAYEQTTPENAEGWLKLGALLQSAIDKAVQP